MLPKMYNENIELIKYVFKRQNDIKLKRDEYFALMVTDEENRFDRPKGDYWDWDKGYIGLERTDNKIYISKKINNRFDLVRGYTFIVKVKDKSKCCLLTYD